MKHHGIAHSRMSPRIDFWLELGSTYTHLTAMRIDQVAASRGVTVRWRPFLLGPIFKSQGWNDSPFNLYEAKGRYMWRDLERRAERYGIPFRRPSTFPRNGLLAARVATAVADEDWAHDYVRAVFRANFVDDLDTGSAEVIREILAALGQEAEPILEAAATQAVKDRLRASTGEAVALGIFGAPSFVVNGELSWGDDRLDDAIDWALGDVIAT